MSSERDEISNRLKSIEGVAWVFRTAARNLTTDIQALTAIPKWETLAQDELLRAEIALQDALTIVRDIRTQYANKPVLSEPYNV